MKMNDENESGQLNLRDARAVLLRRRWWFLGTLFVFGLGAVAAARFWPPQYRSEAIILIQSRRVPDQFVTPNIVNNLSERLESMTQQVLSRARLQQIIQRYNLYPSERAHSSMESVIDEMRKDIKIEPADPTKSQGEQTAFRISYTAKTPQIAQEIAQELTSLFVAENQRTNTQQSISTTDFLETQLRQAGDDLAVQEEKLQAYKARNLGELPEQQQSNLQILNSLESQLTSASNAADRAEQQKIYLESMKAEYKAMRKSIGSADGNANASPVELARAKVNELQKQLSDLESRYTSKHPDVDSLKDQIAQWEAVRQRLESQQKKTETAGGKMAEAPASDPATADVDSRLKATRAEIDSDRAQMNDLRRKIVDAQARLNLTPLREQQLSELTRDYEDSKLNYQSLLQKKLQSQLATNLEKNQEGEQFRVIDPPSLPQKPSQPNRRQVLLIGWLLGLFAGGGLVVVREMSDEVLRNEDDIRQHIRLPILARIPILVSARERTAGAVNRGLEMGGLVLLVLISLALSLYTYKAG
ncbi:MAG: XrtA system polysaccharide chain length determinant [Candidatus Acidiferrales bacterium]